MKKIIIFTCHCGGGHTAVNDALHLYLAQKYQVKSACIFCQILYRIDCLSKITFGKYSFETFYNYILRKNLIKFMNKIIPIGLWYFRIFDKKIKNIIDDFLEKEKPDLVISISVLINNNIILSTKERNIPFLLFPTDLNPSLFIPNLKEGSYPNLYTAISFDNNETLDIFKDHSFPMNTITVTGFPVHPRFLKKQNKSIIKKNFAIQPNKPVVFLMMGSQGTTSIEKFVKQLITVTIPFHLIIVLGKSINIRKKIDTINFPSHISKTILGFTLYVPELMSISDLLITKSGGASICEAIYMNLPSLLDATSEILEWEELNQNFVIKNKFGTVIKQYENIPFLVTKYLQDPTLLATTKKNLELFNKKAGGKEFSILIEKILST